MCRPEGELGLNLQPESYFLDFKGQKLYKIDRFFSVERLQEVVREEQLARQG